MKRVTRVHPLLHVSRESREEALRVYAKNRGTRKVESTKNAGDMGNGESGGNGGDIWDIWRYFRFGVDICELRNEGRVPWTFLVVALGKESWGLERVMGRREIGMQ